MSKFITIFFICWSLSVFGQTRTSIPQDTVIYEWQDDNNEEDFEGFDDEEGDDGESTIDPDEYPQIKKRVFTRDSLRKDSLIFSTVNAFLQRDSLNNTLRPWTDSVYWESIQPHYIIFDSMSVNPYKISPMKYKDTVLMVLFDSLQQNWAMPLKAHHITSHFGHRGSRFHYGTDIRLSIGDSVLSVFDGIVRISKMNPGGYGNYVLVRHYNGLETIYGHLNERLVNVGQHVKAGELIGYGGNTGRSSGPHLHFEVRYQGNAINPTSLYNFESDSLLYTTFYLSPKHFSYNQVVHRSTYHRVRNGDTLWGIAKKYHVSVRQICRLNNISSQTVLGVGRRLRIK